jgi:anaerobic magnesium-protoporphyrin IX monomethyl ester cyclase
VPPIPPGGCAVQTDAVLSRCAGVYTKTDYAIPPIGLAYIAAVLCRDAGITPLLIDSVAEKKSPAQVLVELVAAKPIALVIAAGTATFAADADFVRQCRQAVPGLRTIVVGTHATALPDDALAIGAYDWVVSGEPELTCLEIVQSLLAGTPTDRIAGTSVMIDGTPRHNLARPLVSDLDSLPPPARDLYLARAHYSPPFVTTGRFDVILTGRGCPHKCIYCSTGAYYGRSYRAHSVNRVLSELWEMKRLGVQSWGFWDDTFTLNKQRVQEICNRMVEEKLGIKWMCMGRVDRVDEPTVRAMKSAGCYQIIFGVESGVQHVLDTMQKGITVEQIRAAFAVCRKVGVEASAFFMFGNLGESEADIQATIEFAKQLDPDYASFNVCTPYPGTELYEIVKQETAGRDFASYDALHTDKGGEEARLGGLVRRAYREFYLRPGYIFKRMVRSRSPRELFRSIGAGLDVIGRYLAGRG